MQNKRRQIKRREIEHLEARQLFAADLIEGNANEWGAFGDGAPAPFVENSSLHVTSGSQSLHFKTLAGFDTGVRYPVTANAQWNLNELEAIRFDLFANNPNFSFQGNQPIVVVKAPGGEVRFEPTRDQMPRQGAFNVRIPIDGSELWNKRVIGNPDVTRASQIEVHHDTWDYGFEIWYDNFQLVEKGLDYGDAPLPYPTTAAESGAAHVPNGPTLGQLRDGELNGNHHSLALGDDVLDVADEDGVIAVNGQPSQVKPVKVAVLNFNPIVPGTGGKTLSQYFHWSDPRELANQYINAVHDASDQSVQYVIQSWSDIDDIPVKSDGYDYSVAEYVRNRETNSGWRSNNEMDFPTTLKQYGIDRAVASGEIDEVWIFEDHYFGAWEASMAGPGAYFINGGVYPEVDSERPFAIMGFSYERTVNEMLHNLGHRAENHLQRVFGEDWNQSNPVDAWDLFTANVSATPQGPFGAGNVHFPFNGTSGYDYDNRTPQQTYVYEFENYPDMDLSKTQSLNASDWQNRGWSYERWWLDRMPDNDGTDGDGRQNNWWEYIFDFNDYSPGSGLPKPDPNGLLGTYVIGDQSAEVIVQLGNTSSSAKLDAWIDFNQNGAWDPATETIAYSTVLKPGSNRLSFRVPSNAIAGDTFARFRLSTSGQLGPTGTANDGEVEDYRITLISDGDTEQSPLVSIQSRLTNRSGQPIQSVSVGEEFQLEIFAEDLRSQGSGVFSAALDLTYDPTIVSQSGAIVFGDAFPNQRSVDAVRSGSIDELAAIGDGGLSMIKPQLFARIPFRAISSGIVNFELDPADVLPEHEIALHGLNIAVPPSRVQYGPVQLVVASPSNQWHNEERAWDVNGDKRLSPLDALIVINFLNQHGTQSLSALPGFNVDNFINTINDQVVSPLDALMVINELNSRSTQAEPESVLIDAIRTLPLEDEEELVDEVFSEWATLLD